MAVLLYGGGTRRHHLISIDLVSAGYNCEQSITSILTARCFSPDNGWAFGFLWLSSGAALSRLGDTTWPVSMEFLFLRRYLFHGIPAELEVPREHRFLYSVVTAALFIDSLLLPDAGC